MSYSLKNTILGFVIKYFKYIFVALVVILIFLSTYFILLPKYQQISGKGYLDYEQKKQTLVAKKAELSELIKLKEDLAKISSVEKERLQKILPTAKEIPDIFLQMERLAVESGLKVSRISIKDAGSKQSAATSETNGKKANTILLSGIQTITVSLSVEGDSSYESLKILLDNIEDNMRIIDLDSLSFIPSAEMSEGAFSLNLNTYYLE
ncbi:MAG: type 4a pilus biogenesis protein PilO [Patescibacteria group bacterium]|jgi:Tfp pilus assembly protein PilO